MVSRKQKEEEEESGVSISFSRVHTCVSTHKQICKHICPPDTHMKVEKEKININSTAHIVVDTHRI